MAGRLKLGLADGFLGEHHELVNEDEKEQSMPSHRSFERGDSCRSSCEPHFIRLDLSKLTQSAPTLPSMRTGDRIRVNWRAALEDDASCEALLIDLAKSQNAREVLTEQCGNVFQTLGKTLSTRSASKIIKKAEHGSSRLVNEQQHGVQNQQEKVETEPVHSPQESSQNIGTAPSIPGLTLNRLRLSLVLPQASSREATPPPRKVERNDRAASICIALVIERHGRGIFTAEDIPWTELLHYFCRPEVRSLRWVRWVDQNIKGASVLLDILTPSCPSLYGDHLGAGRHGIVQSIAGSPGKALKRFVVKTRRLRKEQIPRIFNEIAALRALTEAQNKDPMSPCYVIPLSNFGRFTDEGRDIFITLDRAPLSLCEWRRKVQSQKSRKWLAQVIAFYSDVAQALDFIASHGITHNDIRMDNILLVPCPKKNGYCNMRAVLADFGESYCTNLSTSSMGEVENFQFETRGTECIMAPEMLTVCDLSRAQERENFDRLQTFRWGTSSPSDVWGLGCLMFEMTTGSFLYEEALTAWATFFARLTRQKEADALPLIPEEKKTQFWEACSNEVQAQEIMSLLIVGALETDPRRRPTAAAMRDRANKLLQDQAPEDHHDDDDEDNAMTAVLSIVGEVTNNLVLSGGNNLCQEQLEGEFHSPDSPCTVISSSGLSGPHDLSYPDKSRSEADIQF